MEAYRLVHKKQVKDWLNIVTSRKNQDWLLLHLVKHDARAPGGKLFQLKGSVLERMRADFNTDKRDRLVLCRISSTLNLVLCEQLHSGYLDTGKRGKRSHMGRNFEQN